MDDLQWHKLLILCCHCTEKIEALDIEMSGCGEREREWEPIPGRVGAGGGRDWK